jgi:hypothetical protein
LQGREVRWHDHGVGKLLAEETKKWAKVVKFAGIKPN